MKSSSSSSRGSEEACATVGLDMGEALGAFRGMCLLESDEDHQTRALAWRSLTVAACLFQHTIGT